MKELLEKLNARKRMMESRLAAARSLQTPDYPTGKALVNEGHCTGMEDEITFLIELLNTSVKREITDALLEEYGFIDDEPGYWFLEDEDGSPEMGTIRIEQNLRNQSEWRLFIETEENGAETIDLKDFDHLLSVLEENGITFNDVDDDDDEKDESI